VIKLINIKNDGIIAISVGRSRKETIWENRELKWSELLERLEGTTYTAETVEEFRNFPKGKQDEVKDVGGFVGGLLREGRRKGAAVINRTVLTLDADYAREELWHIIELLFDFSCCLYSTHKHSKAKPRFRLVIPLGRAVTPEEYEAVARRVAYDLGMDYFDDTTYEPSRLMYWPSTSSDGIYEFKHQDAQWLKPDEVLEKYADWKDRSSWPQSSRAETQIEKIAEKQEKPKEKKGFVGAFCRTYSVPQAIDRFLAHIYVKAEGNRYTYVKGSTFGGLVIYGKGDFAYSHHSTDPACGKLCNAFDLVRMHKFGEEKDSYGAAINFLKEDEEVKVNLGKERLSLVKEEFGVLEEMEDVEWMKLLEVDKRGLFRPTITNVVLILENDPYLKGKIALNEFSHATMIRGDLPWHKLKNVHKGDVFTDRDDAALRQHMEKVYGISAPNKIMDAVLIVDKKNEYHPIKEYFGGLSWDGVSRVDTLLVDYLGAKDSEYSRAVTRKALVAAVARVFEPGIKYDYMLVLVGRQGLGKSQIIRLLGQSWYSDSLISVQGREAYEQLQDAWIIEMAELSAIKKAEAESVKHFISKTVDSYREAYGRRKADYPRQCIFFGTTNDHEFLKDRTGNRRFWPVITGLCESRKSLWTDMTKSEIDQIWAEAFMLWKQGEALFLDKELEKEAMRAQELHTEGSSKEGMVREFLERLLPSNWSSMDIAARRRFIHGSEFGEAEEGTIRRDKVCAAEIWVELFNGELGKFTNIIAREINDILRNIEGWEPYSVGRGRLRFGKVYGAQRAFLRVVKAAA
jgi:putative DNA primase/helicase